jgi:DNA phosphorothioation-dependent restriction protein DptH
MALEETPANTSDRVSGVFSDVYNIGEQQKAALYNAIREGVEEQGTNFNLNSLIDKLEEIKGQGGPNVASYATLINKIQSFVDMHPFGSEELESWEKLYTDDQNSCHVLQLIGFSKEMQRLITEFSLIDLYWYYRANGNQYKPRVIILDEIQNLDHRLNSPLGQFLTEGRKFGICLVLATQTLSNLDKDERDRLFQASHKLFFRPADTEIKSFATVLSDATGEKVDDWVNRLSNLKRGECYSLGHGVNEKTGKLDINRWAKIKITSLNDRFMEGDA